MPIVKTKKIKASKNRTRDACIKGTTNYVKDRKNGIAIKNLTRDINTLSDQKDASNVENKLIEYTTNQNKCYDENTSQMLISGHNCDPDRAAEQFIGLERAYHSVKNESCKKGCTPNEAFHLIMSFKGKEIPADKIHEIGKEFTRRLCGNSFMGLISTHTNTENYHNHIVISAYAIDEARKFKDELNSVSKFRRISDELSIENGIEIIVENALDDEIESSDEKLYELLEKTKPIPSNIRDFKMSKNKETFKVSLMNDIILTAKESKNFDEFSEKMTKKGYELRKNQKSITYYKPYKGIIRDNRLGYQYKEENLRKYFNSKENFESNTNIKVKINKRNLEVPKYVKDGINTYRYSLFERIVIFFIKIIKEIIRSGENFIKINPHESKLNINILKNRLKNLEKLNELIKKYNITDFNVFKCNFSGVLKEYVRLNNIYKKITYASGKYKKIKEAKAICDELKGFMEEHNLSDAELNMIEYSDLAIQENLAKIDPMNPKTKSRLYRAMHNAPFRLLVPFQALSESDAKEIIYFLSKHKTSNKSDNLKDENFTLPKNLVSVYQYNMLKKEGKILKPKNTDKKANLTPLDLSKYSDQEKELILRYRKSKSLLLSYGLSTENEYSKFLNSQMQPTLNNLDNLRERLNELKIIIKDYNFIKEMFQNNFNIIREPLKMIDDIELNSKNIDNFLKENETELDKLVSLRNILENLDLSPLSDESIVTPPIDIINAVELIYKIGNKNIDIKDIMSFSKDELKEIIETFISNYDIEYHIEELTRIEKEKEERENYDKDIKKNTEDKKEKEK